MAAEKGWYWVAAGVLALGINGSLADRYADLTREARSEGIAIGRGLTGAAMGYLAQFQTGLERPDRSVHVTQAMVQSGQERALCVKAEVNRPQMERVRMRVEVARQQMERVRMMPGMNAAVPDFETVVVPDVQVEVPEVRVVETGDEI